MSRIGQAPITIPAGVDVTVEGDEVLPHPLTPSLVEIVDGQAKLWFTGGCFESPQRATGLSVDHTKVELATALFRAKDRLEGGFGSAPEDEALTERQRTVDKLFSLGGFRGESDENPIQLARKLRQMAGFSTDEIDELAEIAAQAKADAEAMVAGAGS
jgi:hypothetical protein